MRDTEGAVREELAGLVGMMESLASFLVLPASVSADFKERAPKLRKLLDETRPDYVRRLRTAENSAAAE